ncbi:hypothetical protein RSOLAG22IIIB_01204 [Rhizoctonia solani]|uniref:Uncharacterized protein n=1 Tax=Rhizoctonia solani TaxID=456999 RepID=A0A0K6G5E5_9AGAM|nr:hypothetical protein RSOLAG22IIIB_01204 [Rhizoctonia solani]
MPGNRRVTFALSPRPSSPPAPLLPSPEPSADELTSQISALRAELRDGRLTQARQRNQLNQEAAHIAELTRKYKEVKQERQELKAKLVHERDTAAAIQKRLYVAVKNHAEAQDKCARTMADCEGLRMLNEELSLMNKGLAVSKSEAGSVFEEKIAEMECVYRDKLEEAEVAFAHELEETREQLSNGQLQKVQALKKEIESRDAKIKKLEHDLNRQCEINAMFTLDYDRDTNFTKHLSVPLTIPVPETSASRLASGQSGSTKPRLSSPRRPLIHLESNNVTIRKRSRVPSWRGDKEDRPPSRADKVNVDQGAPALKSEHSDQDRPHKRARLGYSSAPAGKESRQRSKSFVQDLGKYH